MPDIITDESVDGASRDDMLDEIKGALNLSDDDTKTDDLPPADAPPVEDEPPAPEPKDEEPPAPEPEDEEESIVPDILLNPDDAPTEEDEVPENLNDKDKNAFIKMRHALAEKDNAIKELNTKLEQQGDPEAVTKLKEELKTAHDAIGRLNLEQHPEFQAKFEAPKMAIIDRVKEILKGGEYDESIADKAASLKTIERIQYLNNVAPDLQPALTPMFGQVDTIDAQKGAALENFKSSSEALRSEIETRNASQRAEIQTKVYNTALANLQDQGHFAYAKVEGKDDWNASVDTLVAKGKELLDSKDILSQTQAVVAGLATPMYLKVIEKQNAQIKSLNAELGKKSKVRRKISTNDGAPTPQSAEDKRKPMSSGEMADTITKRMEERRTAAS